MKRFFSDLKKYWAYTRYSAGSALKAEVASSYLNWLWWVFDPLLYMLVYMFIAVIVFKSQERAFPVFVFCGLTLWDFFNRNVLGSIKLIRGKAGIISKVYLPKYVLVLSRMMHNGVKMLISFALILILMPFFKLPFTLEMLHLVPVFLVLFLLTFGASCIVMHIGVFVDDLYNIMQALLRLVFYMCGIFYSLESRLPAPYNHILLKGNPVSFCIHSMRQVLIYQSVPQYKYIFFWLIIGLLLSVFGVWLIYRYENTYVKVI
ncbi:MAG: ABC transporter permease [Clostridia bacterium]|nr:ABC transporter permease [Clostridia bacterium]